MKITKRQLRRIIQEEARECLNEAYASSPTSQELLDDLNRWREEIQGMWEAIEQNNVETPDMGGPPADIHQEMVAKLERAAAELFSVSMMLKKDAKGQPLDENLTR